MTEQTSVNTVTDKINQQELQHLITVSYRVY